MPPTRNATRTNSKTGATADGLSGGVQGSSSREASSSRGLQAGTSADRTTSGVVTRSSTRKSQTAQEDLAQRPSKGKGQSKDNPPPLPKLWWIFYHQSSRIPEALSVTEDMLDQSLSDVFQLFASEIRDRYGVNVRERTIFFYTPKQNIKLKDINSAWMKQMLAQFGPSGASAFREQSEAALELVPTYLTMQEVFDFVSKENRVLHFIVMAEVIQPEDPNANPQEDEEPDEIPIIIKRFASNIKRRNKITCPSTASKSENYVHEQKDTDIAIYDGRRGKNQGGSRVAPPIQIFHPIFENFYRYLHDRKDPTTQPSEDMIRMTYSFMEEASTISTSESDRAEELRTRLSKILKGCFMPVGERARPDGSVWLTLDGLGIPLILLEVKREYGEGGCDPATQASFSFRTFCLQHSGLLDKCCCPTFLIAAGGPWLAVLGGVFTDKFIIQRLTELTWTGYSSTYEDMRVYWLARIFNALRMCSNDLVKYYEVLNQAKFTPSDYFVWNPRLQNQTGLDKFVKGRLFPYPQNFIEEDEHGQAQIRRFRYLNPLEECSACVTYLAEICHDEDGDGVQTEKIVVKFVAQYGEEVHRFLAKEGHAPKLRYCGPLLREDGTSAEHSWWSSAPHYEWAFPGLYFGQVRMVVMDYVEACDDADLPGLRERGQQIAEVLKKLHDNGFVFGDLRQPNVIFAKEDKKVKFIDHDWSGRYQGSSDGLIPDPKDDEKPRYPLGLSRDVTWPIDVKEIGLQAITPEHDWFMLKKHFNYPPDTDK